jgi:hypothetical protein
MTVDTQHSQPWWKYGHVWLVLAGPVIVVIAALVTAYIAMSAPDPVLAQDYYRRGLEMNKTLAEEKARQLAPALQTRNHVVTPEPAAPTKTP